MKDTLLLARRRFPLFIIISNNPWLMGIGIVLFVLWLVSSMAGDD